MHDASDATAPPGRVQTVLLVIGSAGFLVAMVSDAIAVLGRHTGFALIGSIELFQVSAVIALSAAMLLASLQNRHATVDLILTRVSPRVRTILTQVGRLMLAVTFGLLTAGSAWIAAELWPMGEMTELLSIPIAPFRLAWIASCAAATLHFVIQFARGMRS